MTFSSQLRMSVKRDYVIPIAVYFARCDNSIVVKYQNVHIFLEMHSEAHQSKVN